MVAFDVINVVAMVLPVMTSDVVGGVVVVSVMTSDVVGVVVMVVSVVTSDFVRVVVIAVSWVTSEMVGGVVVVVPAMISDAVGVFEGCVLTGSDCMARNKYSTKFTTMRKCRIPNVKVTFDSEL